MEDKSRGFMGRRGFVFSNKLGGHLTHGIVYKNFKRIEKHRPAGSPLLICGIYATAALRAGDDVKTVQETLGHFSVSLHA